jgi:hypothetical protein
MGAAYPGQARKGRLLHITHYVIYDTIDADKSRLRGLSCFSFGIAGILAREGRGARGEEARRSEE